MSIPAELKYSATHEWVRVEGDTAVVGITDHAQSELGDIVYLELPEAGRVLAVDEMFGTVESVKAVSDLYSPVAGEVVESNTGIADSTETVNQDPYGAGWLIKVKLSGGVDGLMDAAAYEQLLQESDH